MRRTRALPKFARLLAITLAITCLPTACGASHTGSQASTSTPGGGRSWSIVALGDSVPSGYACDCTPYPQLSATRLEARSGQTVTASNDAVAGYSTANVLHQLDSNAAVIDEVRNADVSEVNVGANDVPYNGDSCGTSVECYAPLVAPMEHNLVDIVDRVQDLTFGHSALVVLFDYWSIWLGGTYAREKGNAYVRAVRDMTGQVDAAIQETATASGSAYVSERHAFKGPSFGAIESKYLASDGEHPNAAGHEAIATAAEAEIERALPIEPASSR